MYSPTANFVAGQLVVCQDYYCEQYDYHNDGLTKFTDTRSIRNYHSSAQHEERILLIGGYCSEGSTEWIPTDGGDSQIGPFVVRHAGGHCTIQVSSDLIVVTDGGLALYPDYPTLNYVTEYQLTGDAIETVMTSLINGRDRHACGVYQEAGGQQVRISW